MYANDGEDGMEEEDIEITDEEAHMELEQLLSERGWDALSVMFASRPASRHLVPSDPTTNDRR